LADLHSNPINGAIVTVRNEVTGAEAHTTTQKNGTYRFSGLEPGEYTLEAESPQLGRGHVEGLVVIAGHEARVQVALVLERGAVAPELAGLQQTETREAGAPEAEPQKVLPAAETINAVPPQVVAETTSQEAVQEVPARDEAPRAATNAAQSQETLALTRQQVLELPREMPETVTPELTATVVEEPLQVLVLAERKAEESSPSQAPVPAATPGQPVQSIPGGSETELAAGKNTGEMGSAAREADAGAAQAAPMLLQPKPQSVQPANASQAALNASGPVTSEEIDSLTADQLQTLPATGRRWQDFVLGTQAGAAGSLGQTAERPATYEVDGASLGLAFGGANRSGKSSSAQGGTSEIGSSGSAGEESLLGQAWTGGHGFAISEAAIREVQTASGNVEAEAERSGGGRMNVETQQGSNGLHGQGFLFDRQNNWGAKNPFSQWVQESAKATLTAVPVFTAEAYTPSDQETTWGFGLGRQIRKDKLFWFAALDSNQRNDPGLATVKHPDKFFLQPTNDQMQVLSARLGLSSTNPVAEGLAAYSSILETLDGLLGPSPRTSSQWVGFARLDWQAAERHRFTLEGIGAHWNAPGGGLTRVSETYGSHSFGSSEAGEEWLMGRWEAFVTPNLLLVSQGSLGREIQNARPETPSTYEQTLLSGNAWGQLPQITVDSRYGFTVGNPSRLGQGNYPSESLGEGQVMLDWVRGSLLVKSGFELSHNKDATSLLRNQTGSYYYSSVENFASDALAFAAYGISGQLNPLDQHNCDQTGKVWRDSTGQLHGLVLQL
jgi:hypothetical protein